MISGPFTWYTIAYGLAQAVQNKLTTDVSGVFVKPGDIVWDAADCGAIYATWSQVFFTESFPQPIQVPAGGCWPPQKAGEFIIQVARCMPPPPGLPGTTIVTGPGADLDGIAAQQLSQDAEELLLAVMEWCCQQQEANEITNYVVPLVSSVGPEGSVVAVEIRVIISVTTGM